MAQVSILSSAVLANRDKFKPNDLRTAGRNFQKRARVLTLAVDSIGSQYGFFTLPSNAVIVSAQLSTAALGTSCAADIGLWESKIRGGFSATTGWQTQAGSVANAKQFFGAAVAIASAQTKTEQYYANASFVTLLNCDQMVWQQLGLATDPSQSAEGAPEYDVVATLTAATVAGGTILFEVSYKLQ